MMAAAPNTSVSIRVSDPSPGCPPVCGAAAGSGAALGEADGEPVGDGDADGEGDGEGDGDGDGDGVSVGVPPAAASRPLEPKATTITAATSIRIRLAVNIFAMFSSFQD
jgi:hypothetical protein